MAFNDLELARIERTVGKLCERRAPPPHLRHEVSMEYRVDGNAVTVFERRAQVAGAGLYRRGRRKAALRQARRGVAALLAACRPKVAFVHAARLK
ncbi:MAG: hypothetical protein WA418_18225, partial [Bradyrhizobium sp.]